MTRGKRSGINVKKKEWEKKPQLKFVPPHLKKDDETKEPTSQRDEEEGRETQAAAAAKQKDGKGTMGGEKEGYQGKERGKERRQRQRAH